MKKIFVVCLLYFAALTIGSSAYSSGLCYGRWVNPITDVCWKCLFPISLGSVGIFTTRGMKDIPNPASPVCACPIPVYPFVRVGLAFGFWEPARMAESVRSPFCFPALGGLKLDTGIVYAPPSAQDITDNRNHESYVNYQVHWYAYPLLYWLNLISNAGCKTGESFDIAYLTELDPLWMDAETSFILNPEAALFANIIATAACTADCVAATVKQPINKLFWCSGCQGKMYPLIGTTTHFKGGVSGTLQIAGRVIAKLSRLGLTKVTSGAAALCRPRISLIIKKSQYRFQMVYPRPQTGTGKFCCNRFGADEQIWSPGHHYPLTGLDHVYLIWRKRNCCMSVY